jgi:hypothetical protein
MERIATDQRSLKNPAGRACTLTPVDAERAGRSCGNVEG